MQLIDKNKSVAHIIWCRLFHRAHHLPTGERRIRRVSIIYPEKCQKCGVEWDRVVWLKPEHAQPPHKHITIERNHPNLPQAINIQIDTADLVPFFQIAHGRDPKDGEELVDMLSEGIKNHLDHIMGKSECPKCGEVHGETKIINRVIK